MTKAKQTLLAFFLSFFLASGVLFASLASDASGAAAAATEGAAAGASGAAPLTPMDDWAERGSFFAGAESLREFSVLL